ncbi:glycosyltransferase, partial [Candidatus Sumerlaeota bacterium]|nr:glycosyltransferase [Candidatus Sumerlaeota bacterium]
MRIGIDANSLSDPKRTGIGRYSFAVLDQLFIIAPENEYYLYAAQPIDQRVKQEWSRYDNVIFREGNFPSRYVWQQLFLARWLRQDKVDVHLALDGLLPLGSSIPSVTIVHDLIWYRYPHSTAPHVRWVYRLRQKSSARKARHCIADSKATKSDFLKYAGIASSKVTVIYGGVEPKFKVQSEEKITQVLKEHNVCRPYI